MRWLIVGPYPPEQGSGPAAAGAMVAQRLAAGDTVHAVSPRPSAAHEHLPLGGVRAMWALARLARVQRTTGLWLRVEPGILLQPGLDRRRGLAERVALVALLRRFDDACSTSATSASSPVAEPAASCSRPPPGW